MNILRWISFLPATVIIYLLIGSASEIIFQIIFGVQTKYDISVAATIYKCLVTLFSAFLGPTVSCLIIPKGKLKLAVIYLIFNSFSVNFKFLSIRFSDPDVWRYSTPIIFSVIGCALSVFIIKSQFKRNFSKVELGFLIYSLTSLTFFIIFLSIIYDASVSEAIGIFIGILVTISFIIVQLVLRAKKEKQQYAQT